MKVHLLAKLVVSELPKKDVMFTKYVWVHSKQTCEKGLRTTGPRQLSPNYEKLPF